MTKTLNDLVKRVLDRLHVTEGNEPIEAEDMSTVLGAFADMIDGWFADGLTPTDEAAVPVPLVEGTVYTNTSPFPLKMRHFQGVSAMLAIDVAETFNKPVGEGTQRAALLCRQRIYAAFMPDMVTTVDRALRRLPSSHLWAGSF